MNEPSSVGPMNVSSRGTRCQLRICCRAFCLQFARGSAFLTFSRKSIISDDDGTKKLRKDFSYTKRNIPQQQTEMDFFTKSTQSALFITFAFFLKILLLFSSETKWFYSSIQFNKSTFKFRLIMR